MLKEDNMDDLFFLRTMPQRNEMTDICRERIPSETLELHRNYRSTIPAASN